MYLNKTDLKNNILKCDKCLQPFDEYCQPKLLPCFYTICTTCELTINREAISKQFKCEVCKKYHYLVDDGFALNKKIRKFSCLKRILKILLSRYSLKFFLFYLNKIN
jgi:hypothetical protein